MEEKNNIFSIWLIIKKRLFLLFILGTLLTLGGWFFDSAEHFPWLINRIAPSYYQGSLALEKLSLNRKSQLGENDSGFHALLEYWPELNDLNKVKYIGRSGPALIFGSQVRNDFNLILYDEDHKDIEPIWQHSLAQKFFEEAIEGKIFFYGSIIFFIGFAITSISGLVEFLKEE